MGKGHRDNHRARKKRGNVAFAKKAERRAPDLDKCSVCGNRCRQVKQIAGACPNCAAILKRTL
jgi:hypothetical protein